MIQKPYALAWSVNPSMIHLLLKEGFKILSDMGKKGEGLDVWLDRNILYPTLMVPKAKYQTEASFVKATHLFKSLK
jgi:hypothetical protein